MPNKRRGTTSHSPISRNTFSLSVRLTCRLPHPLQACNWTGDYSELSSHLTSTETHRGARVCASNSQASPDRHRRSAPHLSSPPDAAGLSLPRTVAGPRRPVSRRRPSRGETPPTATAEKKAAVTTPHAHVVAHRALSQERTAGARAEAEGLKEAANAKFQERQFHESIKLYSKAIAVQPGVATFYGAPSDDARAGRSLYFAGVFISAFCPNPPQGTARLRGIWLGLSRSASLTAIRRAGEKISAGSFAHNLALRLLNRKYRLRVMPSQAIALDSGYLRPYTRLAKAQCELGEFDAACDALERAMVKGQCS